MKYVLFIEGLQESNEEASHCTSCKTKLRTYSTYSHSLMLWEVVLQSKPVDAD